MSLRSATLTRLPATLSDRYTVLLACVLLGYAILGKGFAYLGVPPLFMGEISLVLGLIVAFRSDCLFAALAQLPCLLLTILMVWVLARTIPNIGVYGLNAVRDSVVVLYGFFAFIVIALLVEKPERIKFVIRWFAVFTMIYAMAGPFLYFFEKMAAAIIPMAPGSDTPLINIRSGEVAVHLSGAAVFALLGLRRVGKAWVVGLLIGIAIISAQSRGGMLAIVGPVMFASVVAGKGRSMGKILLAVIALLAICYALNVEIPLPGNERPLGARQVVDNFLSVFSSSEDAQLDGTKQFRVRWWQYIQSYTFHGDYFWTGKGFGVNLAQADGFVVGDGTVPLRAPHSVHMTMLARSGVPELVFWGLTLIGVFYTLLSNMVVARRRQDHTWANLFLFFACYLAAIIIDASFDVALEGPMVGIWFWVLFGLGVGSTMVYRGTVERRRNLPRMSRIAPLGALTMGLSICLLLGSGRAQAGEDVSATAPERLVLDLADKPLQNPNGSCLTYQDIHDAIIENITIGPCANHGILLIDSQRVTIRNVTIHDTGETGIYVRGSQSIDIVGNTITNSITGIVALASEAVNVSCNTLENVRGPIPSGQFVQFNDVHGPGNQISCNVGRSQPGFGKPEDAISTYRSSGVDASPIVISENLIVGGGPSESGGGIMLGDDGGSNIVARSNVLVDPGQYGIAVASGENMSILDNVIFGRRQAFTNVGISVWNQYPHDCRNITVSGNQVQWYAKTGAPNPFWDGENCGPIADLARNDFAAPISPAIAELKAPQCSCTAAAGRH